MVQLSTLSMLRLAFREVRLPFSFCTLAHRSCSSGLSPRLIQCSSWSTGSVFSWARDNIELSLAPASAQCHPGATLVELRFGRCPATQPRRRAYRRGTDTTRTRASHTEYSHAYRPGYHQSFRGEPGCFRVIATFYLTAVSLHSGFVCSSS